MIVLFLSINNGFAQSVSDITIVSLDYKNAPMETILKAIESQYDIKFSYLNETIEDVKVTVSLRNERLPNALKFILAGTDLTFKIYEEMRNIVIFRAESRRTIPKFTINGYVEDAESGERLIGANIYDPERHAGAATNVYGFFSMTLPMDSISLIVSYLGYEPTNYDLFLDRDIQLDFSLTPTQIFGDTIEVVAHVESIVERTAGSSIDIPVRNIKSLPALIGEIDILKTMLLLPGVQFGTEGNSGLYVRGGSADQNLILLDGATIYNASHCFGLFSVFSSDAIKNVKITKGGFPARFGGRLSSVVEVNLKEGNNQEFKGNASIGLISSKLTVEGPINKGKSSYIVSGRRTYLDFLLYPFLRDKEVYVKPYFYDLHAKINHTFSHTDRIFFSIYSGNDRLFVDQETEDIKINMEWGNITSTFRWNHILNKKLFSNTTVTYSNYSFAIGTDNSIRNFEGEIDSYVMKYFSKIRDFNFRLDFDYTANPSNNILFGANFIYHIFEPGIIHFNKESTSTPSLSANVTPSDKITSREFSTYIEHDIKFNRQFSADFGIHSSLYNVSNEIYTSLQPRISAAYKLRNQWAVKSSYVTMAQYIHLLSNTSVGSPTDLWVPATNRVRPQYAKQAVLGISKLAYNDQYEVSVEAYYKKINNLIAYKEGAAIMSLDSDWQDKVVNGSGRSYGIELFVQKNYGKTTGWLGYTYSQTYRKFEEFNNGKEFPFRFDRRQDFKIVMIHNITPNVEFSANWIYGTGNALTLPVAKYLRATDTIFLDYWQDFLYSYSDRNSFRMRAYHRLDLGIKLYRRKKDSERIWTFSIYNAYSRKNPYFYYFDAFAPGAIKFQQVSLFPIIPAISYSFTF